jgi:guanylate kinase
MESFDHPLYIISAPSGTGKTSIIKRCQRQHSNIILSISHTTRSPRRGEREGVDYFFISEERFLDKVERDEFVEWARVHGNYYGTSRQFIQKATDQGKIVILDIDVQGAMQLKEIENLFAIFIFIVPPSISELEKRLIARGTEDEESLRRRIKNAVEELQFKKKYDNVIVNDDLEKAVKECLCIIFSGDRRK